MPVTVLQFIPGIALPPRAYLDTNLLLYARDQQSAKYRSASTCLGEMIIQGIQLNVSALVFDELWWIYFRQSYKLATGRELTPQEYKRDPTIWQHSWPRIRRITDEILEWGGMNTLEAASPLDLVNEAAALMDLNPLAPRDAFHLAITLRHAIPSFVTADSDFDDIQLPTGRHLTVVKF